ncbi:hypothetical protein BDR04DRAFT_1151122 [Suillus decipiens]|nr:hypothetical protein BDR04DRAFT_1151122 [Suillus decipiens]
MAELLVTPSMVCNLSLAMCYVQGTIKKAAIRLLGTKNFSDVILKLDVECKFNLSPDDLLPVAFIPSPPPSLASTESSNDYKNYPINLHYEVPQNATFIEALAATISDANDKAVIATTFSPSLEMHILQEYTMLENIPKQPLPASLSSSPEPIPVPTPWVEPTSPTSSKSIPCKHHHQKCAVENIILSFRLASIAGIQLHIFPCLEQADCYNRRTPLFIFLTCLCHNYLVGCILLWSDDHHLSLTVT